MKAFFLSLAAACLAAASCSTAVETADYNVIPLPNEVKTDFGGLPFILDEETVIKVQEAGTSELSSEAAMLSDYIYESTGIRVKLGGGDAASVILLSTGDVPELSDTLFCRNGMADEGYRLTVSGDTMKLLSPSSSGLFHGLQTIRKSLPQKSCRSVRFPAGIVTDCPEFGYRGMHLDAARHFYTVDEVKEYIDILALHCMNYLHFHLTDDQAWRIEIRKYPLLAKVGGRNYTVTGRKRKNREPGRDGSFYYTQEELRDIIDYASERYIEVIPEIELPGHFTAASSAYPEFTCDGGEVDALGGTGMTDHILCAGNDSSIAFAEEILAEVMELFPSKYVHTGGDECPYTSWKLCPKCQARIAGLGLVADSLTSAEQKLQGWFTAEIDSFVASKGKTMIGWDEVAGQGLPTDVTVMSWRGLDAGMTASAAGYDVIMCPGQYCYFDHYQTDDVSREPKAIGGYLPLETVYSFSPYGSCPDTLSDLQRRHIIGGQANIWAEYVPSLAHAEYMVLPRMAALTEKLWTPSVKMDFGSFLKRAVRMTDLYAREGYNYSKQLFAPSPETRPDIANGGLNLSYTTVDGSFDVYYSFGGKKPGKGRIGSRKYVEPLAIDGPCTVNAVSYRDGKRYGGVVTSHFGVSKTTGRSIETFTNSHRRYTYAGPSLLVDGILGTEVYSSGKWIGYNGQDVVAEIDLGGEKELSSANVNVCINKTDGCFDARGMEISVSQDGVNYTKVASAEYPQIAEEGERIYIAEHRMEFAPVNAKYVRFVVKCDMCMPGWMRWGSGGPAFLFVDELAVR